jgi:mono/diheme cytochrome c family protein
MFRKILRPVTLVGVLLATVPTASLSSAQERSDADGRTAYANLGCESCHGTEGVGTTAGPSLVTGALPLAEFIAYVRQPKGTMEAYSVEDISDRGLSDIYAYLEPATHDSAAGRVEAGATLYRKTGCYECHSNEAQGGAQGPRLGPDPVGFATFAWYTRYPTGAMPPYTARVLSDRDLEDIYAFVEARPEPPPVSSIPLLAPKD